MSNIMSYYRLWGVLLKSMIFSCCFKLDKLYLLLLSFIEQVYIYDFIKAVLVVGRQIKVHGKKID